MSQEKTLQADDLQFLLDKTLEYSIKQKEFFSFSECWKKIVDGTIWVFFLKDEDINKALCLVELTKNYKNEDFLELKLVSGSLKDNIEKYIDFISNQMYNICKIKNIPYFVFEARLGWNKYLRKYGLKPKSVLYLANVKDYDHKFSN